MEIRLVTADGSNPLDRASFAEVTVEVEQVGRPLTQVTRSLEGELDLGVEIDTLGGETQLRVRFEGGGNTLTGRTPRFVPATAGGLVRIVMGEPGTCERVTSATLVVPRQRAGIARSDTFVSVFGFGL